MWLVVVPTTYYVEAICHSGSQGHSQVHRVKYDCILSVNNNKVGAVKPSSVLWGNDCKLYTNHHKVSKVMYDMLGSDLTSHIIGLTSVQHELKLLFMSYSGGYLSLLYTASFGVSIHYRQATFQTLKKI